MPNAFRIYIHSGDARIGSGSLLPGWKKAIKKTKSSFSSIDFYSGFYQRGNADTFIFSGKAGTLRALPPFGEKVFKKSTPIEVLDWQEKSGARATLDFYNEKSSTQDLPSLIKGLYIGNKSYSAAEGAWLAGNNKINGAPSSLIANLKGGNDEVDLRSKSVQYVDVDTADGSDLVLIGGSFAQYEDRTTLANGVIRLGRGDDLTGITLERGGYCEIFGDEGNDQIYVDGGSANLGPVATAKVKITGGAGADTFYSGSFIEAWITDYEVGVDKLALMDQPWKQMKAEVVSDPNGMSSLKISFGGITPGFTVSGPPADASVASIVLTGISSLSQVAFVDYGLSIEGFRSSAGL